MRWLFDGPFIWILFRGVSLVSGRMSCRLFFWCVGCAGLSPRRSGGCCLCRLFMSTFLIALPGILFLSAIRTRPRLAPLLLQSFQQVASRISSKIAVLTLPFLLWVFLLLFLVPSNGNTPLLVCCQYYPNLPQYPPITPTLWFPWDASPSCHSSCSSFPAQSNHLSFQVAISPYFWLVFRP